VYKRQVDVQRMPDANHTFSCARWRDDVSDRIANWLVTR